MISYKPITSSNLSQAFALVSIGFGLHSGRSERLYQLITSRNSSMNYYGYCIYKDNIVIGAIFTPLQGFVDWRPGVSLILFYVMPIYRGVTVLQFLAAAIKDMKQRFAFISDYTASDEVDLMLRSFGFRYMNISYSRATMCSIFKGVFRAVFQKVGLKMIDSVDAINSGGIRYSPSPSTKLATITIPSISKSIKLVGFWSKRKSLVQYFHILWTSDEDCVLREFGLISALMLIRFGSLLLFDAPAQAVLRCRCSSIISLNKKCRYLFWSEDSCRLNILAVGSELAEL